MMAIKTRIPMSVMVWVSPREDDRNPLHVFLVNASGERALERCAIHGLAVRRQDELHGQIE